MATSSCCAICGGEDSWMHSLITCMARCVWALSDPELVEHLLAMAEPDAKSWLFSMQESMPHDEFVKLTVTLWAIWSARRKLIHEGSTRADWRRPISLPGTCPTYNWLGRHRQYQIRGKLLFRYGRGALHLRAIIR